MEHKYHVLPATPTNMEDLPPNPNYVPPEERKAVAEKQALKKVRKVRRRVKRSQVGQAPAAKGKATPRQTVANTQQQPRDRMGRFASFAGRAIVGTAKGIASVAKGTPKALKAADRIATNALQGMTGYQQHTRRTRRGR